MEFWRRRGHGNGNRLRVVIAALAARFRSITIVDGTVQARPREIHDSMWLNSPTAGTASYGVGLQNLVAKYSPAPSHITKRPLSAVCPPGLVGGGFGPPRLGNTNQNPKATCRAPAFGARHKKWSSPVRSPRPRLLIASQPTRDWTSRSTSSRQCSPPREAATPFVISRLAEIFAFRPHHRPYEAKSWHLAAGDGMCKSAR